MAQDCCSICLASCCVFFESSLATFCDTVSCGLRGTNGSGDGLCGSCLKSSFDEDGFEVAERKQEEERSREVLTSERSPDAEHNELSQAENTSQPVAGAPMTAKMDMAVS